MRTILYIMLWAALLLSGCGGGFGTDSGHASVIGPGIFEPDTAR